MREEAEPNIPAIPKAKDVYIRIYNAHETMHTDQTECLQATLSRGNQYVMVLVEVDGNFINAEPMKNRSEGAMIKAYHALWTRLTSSGTEKPMTHILANEASAEYKKEIQKNVQSNWYLRTTTEETLRKEPSKLSRATSNRS